MKNWNGREISSVGAVFLSVSALAAVSGSAIAGPAFSDDFESAPLGEFPSGNWMDLGDSSIPSPGAPSGGVIRTTGLDGNLTNAFQVDQRRTSSQGLLRAIDQADMHRLSADMRVDLHPTPPRGGDWTGGIGFFQQEGPPVDINQEPQAVVYVQGERWFFFGSTSTSNFRIIPLGPAPVVEGAWYNITMQADTTTGSFEIDITDANGMTLVDQTVSIPNYVASLGAYNRIAFFDGEFDPRPAEAGQFSVDNVTYVPSPGSIAALAGMGVLGLSRRRVR